MSNRPPVTILHISDLHFKIDRVYNQKIVLDALLNDMKTMFGLRGKPDLIIFSGDLVHNADDSRVYDRLYDVFIEPLLHAANCDISRIYFTPGNHDVQRTGVQEKLDEHNRLKTAGMDRDALNQEYFSGALMPIVRTKQSAFWNFHAFFEPEGVIFSNDLVQVYDLKDQNVSLLAINTSWMGYGGIDKVSDLRQLFVPEASLMEAIEKIPEGRFLVGFHHHPTAWFSESSETDFRDALSKRMDLQLFGHVHDPRPMIVTDANGRTIQNQSGALYTWRTDRYLGYSIVRVEPSKKFVESTWRSYYDRRKCFDVATNIDQNGGVLYSSPEAREYFEGYIDSKKRETSQDWCSEVVASHHKSRFDQGLTDRPMSDLFVAPPLMKQVFKEETDKGEGGSFVEQIISFKEIIDTAANVLLWSYPEYGKTTLLQQICVHVALKANGDRPTTGFIPVLLSFNDFSPGTNRVEKAIRDSLPDLPQGISVKDLLNSGAFLVCVDDVNFAESTKMKELRRFVSTHKSNRFILTSQRNRDAGGLDIDLNLPVHFDRVTLQAFRRNDVRALVKKWDEPGKSEEEMLERVVSELRAINVPQTPINSSLLLVIICNDQSFSPLNRPTLIERFIEALLKKRSPSEAQRKKFDFKNQIHFLGHISEHMCRTNRYLLTYEELFFETDAYLKNLGLAFAAKDIIDNLIESRILSERFGDKLISFRFRAFLEFFVAQKIKSSPTFKGWVLQEDRYLSYLNELEYYSGLERSDLGLLELVGERHAIHMNKIFGDKFIELMKGDHEHIIPMSYEESLAFSDELAQQLNETPLSEVERDDLLDTEIPRDSEGRQEVFRPVPKDESSRFILSLFLYSNLIKNSELVSNAEKRKHLSLILRSWAFIFMGSFLHIPSLVKNRKMIVNGLTYTVSYPKEYSDERVAKLISINMPKELARLIYVLMGTEKLEVQLREANLDDSIEPKIVKFFKDSLYMDLKLPNWWNTPERFSKEMKDSRYFKEAMLAKVSEVYRLGAFPKGVEVHLQDQMVELYASLYAPDRSQLQTLRNSRKQSLQRQRNLRMLRAKFEEE